MEFSFNFTCIAFCSNACLEVHGVGLETLTHHLLLFFTSIFDIGNFLSKLHRKHPEVVLICSVRWKSSEGTKFASFDSSSFFFRLLAFDKFDTF